MKISLCFSGQVRAFSKTFAYYNENLFQYHDVDVFIHSWGSEEDEINQQIIDLYKPKAYLFEPQPVGDFDTRYTNTPMPERHPSRFTYASLYSMYRCRELLKQSSTPYDWSIRTRTDFALNLKIPFEDLDNSKLYIPNCWIVPARDYGNDQFAFGSTDTIIKYMSTFEKLDEYYNAGTPLIGEDMMRATLHTHDLHGDKLVYCDMRPPFPPGPLDCNWHSLIRDDYYEWAKK
jgi:hypothetical protein